MGRLRAPPSRLRNAPGRFPQPKKERAAVYGTAAHERWRDQVLERAGHACQGRDHDETRPRSGVRLYADHKIEISDGGDALDVRNGQALCASCHGLKTARARSLRYSF